MKKAENCVKAKINHIHFHGDCLIFEYTKSKGHQKEEKNLGTWNGYANPSRGVQCIPLLTHYLFGWDKF